MRRPNYITPPLLPGDIPPMNNHPEVSWETRKGLINFLKQILPYWESDDLDDYMYVVRPYDLDRVAGKISSLLSQSRKEVVKNILGIPKVWRDGEASRAIEDYAKSKGISLKDK